MMLKVRAALLIISVLALVAACEGQSQEVVELPTLAVLPSLTPSDTPTSTFTPTPTHTPTHTLTPTPSNTPTITPTNTATFTVTPSLTVTASITPSLTPTFTPTFTLTPSLTPTSNLPSIMSFTASSNNVSPNTAVTLRWSSISDSARIDQLNQQGAITQTFPVAASGELVVTVPANLGRLVVYRLKAIRGEQETSQSIPITLRCEIDWFFGNEFAPSGAGCPRAVGAIDDGRFQSFERGVMIYVEADGLDNIYGLQNSDNRYIVYDNNWNGDSLDFDDPPDDLEKPDQMFRWAFLNTNAPVGSWLSSIGWGTDDINDGDRTIQFEDTGAFYIDAPGGAVYRFSGGNGGTWTRVK